MHCTRINMRLAAIAAALLASAAAMAQGDPAIIAKIVEEGKNHNKVMEHLTYLTQRIGARLTGSPQADAACKFVAGQFKKFGLKNVTIEEWGEMPVGFTRGKTQVARMIAPIKRDLVFTTPAWSPGTKGSVKAEAVAEPRTKEEFDAMKDKLKGAWVIMAAGASMRGPAAGNSELSALLDNAGIAGRVYGTADARVHTNGRFTGLEWDKLPTQVRIMISKPDMDVIKQNMENGQKVMLEFNIDNKFIKGPVKMCNVYGDIVGTEKPDEMVIIGGHLDSWNGPGSQGACDNGTGSMVAVEAARILAATGAKPKRTVRFMVWTGEEQGLLGSRGYVTKHKDEMAKISAVFVDDGGTNYEGGVSCTEAMKPMLEKAFAASMAAFPDMPMRIDVTPTFRQPGGSDHMSFVSAGVPGFFWFETGRSDYGFVWHTQNDRLEYAIPEYLVQSSTNAALVSYNLACADNMLPRWQANQAPSTAGLPSLGSITEEDFCYLPHDSTGAEVSHRHDEAGSYYGKGEILQWLEQIRREANAWKLAKTLAKQS